MAKLSLINREKKRRDTAEKLSAKRTKLLNIIDDFSADEEVRMKARLELQKMPRNAHPTRQRNRCFLTGRPRGFFRRFGLSRGKLRDLAMRGEIPGITKASW